MWADVDLIFQEFLYNIIAKDFSLFKYPSVCLGVSLSEKPWRTKTQLRELPLVLDQQDWVEGTTASRAEWSNLALLHPHGWRRLPRRKAGCIASAIDNLLATKEVDAVDVCPGTDALSRAPRLLILLTLSLPLLWTGPAARRSRCSGMCLRWCAFANTAVRREMRFHCYHYLAEEEGHISLWVNAWLPGRATSPQRRRV